MKFRLLFISLILFPIINMLAVEVSAPIIVTHSISSRTKEHNLTITLQNGIEIMHKLTMSTGNSATLNLQWTDPTTYGANFQVYQNGNSLSKASFSLAKKDLPLKITDIIPKEWLQDSTPSSEKDASQGAITKTLEFNDKDTFNKVKKIIKTLYPDAQVMWPSLFSKWKYWILGILAAVGLGTWAYTKNG